MKNPFPIGVPVQGKDLIGRKEEAYRNAIDMERPFFDELWLRMFEKKHYTQILREIILSKESLYSNSALFRKNISRILRELKNIGIIEKKEGRYRLKDPFFEEYIKLRLEL